jgi:hypothetical protein
MSIIQGNAHTSTGGYQIERSLRFNTPDAAYLNRTFSTPTAGTKWTYSLWMKKCGIAGTGTNLPYLLCTAGSGAQGFIGFGWNQADDIIFGYGGFGRRVTPSVFRDYSAWYHLVFSIDTTQGTEANRAKLYVNGVQQTWTTITSITQNDTTQINQAVSHLIGRQTGQPYDSLNAYLTEINFIDGQALTPSDFGETDANTGVWKPKKYGGSYGTNGFYLKFADNSNTTAATLGKDSSGNGNNWTPNGFSVTAGTGNDSLVDTPTNYGSDTGAGGEVRGNYCTLNPLIPAAAGVTLSDGNLRYTNTSGGANQWYTTIIGLSGAFYYEATCTTRGASDQYNYVGDGNALYATNGQIYIGGSLVTTVAAYTSGDVIGVAFGGAGGSGLQFFKNGTQVYSASASGGNTPIVNGYNSCVWDMNFGQRPFAYTAPSGFKALCTQNLPTPAIAKGNQYFDVLTWSGTGGSSGATRSITGLNFQPDFLWEKARSSGSGHQLLDVVRGVGQNKVLASNSTGAEPTPANTESLYGWLSSFNSDGFTTTNGTSTWDNWNKSGDTYVAWNWKAGGTGVTNTVGSITSTVSVNTTAGFSVVTWTGNGGSSEQVGTGLSTTSPIAMAIVKRRSGTSDWWVGHRGILGANFAYRVLLNSTAANSGSGPYVLGSQSNTNGDRLYLATEGLANTVTYVAYCFQQIAGYSAFGSYTGNGSSDGPFVYLGFRPKFFMTKRTDGAGDNWHIHDTTRSTYNIAYADLRPNTSDVENTSAYPMDILSNGIKWRQGGSDGNESGGTYIYVAFAENPFKYSLAR